jgi:hypothetical protein
MVRPFVRSALMAAVCTAALALIARADCCAPAPDCGAPAFRTICCTEWRPEAYQATRVCYRTEYHQETYTAYRCEYVPEVRTRTVTVCRMVPEVRTELRTYCVSVPSVETRTVMKPCWTCRPVTHVVCKTEDHGHYECHEVPCGPSLCDRVRKCFRRHDCCDECEPVRTKTVRCWVPCPVTVQVPVTRMERVCEYRPVTFTVTTCRQEVRQQPVTMTVCRPVTEVRNETYTVCVPRQVAVPCTRTVPVSVPYTQTVTLTRMVPYTVQKQVPVAACCSRPCCH